MPDGLILFGRAILTFLDPVTLAYVMGASLVGLIIGALPGLTATMGVALMTTLTLRMSPDQAITVLVCVYIGAIYGGSRSAILLNIPGTPANAAACLDGHALAKQGQAGRAIGISTTGSIMGTLIGIFFLALFTPILGDWALSFQSYEFFWLALFGVIISANLAGEDALKGWIAGFLGLFIAQIGQDGIHAFERFSFGQSRPRRRDLADSGLGRRVRLRRGVVGDARAPAGADRAVDRLGLAALARRDPVLAHHHPLWADRHRHRHHPRRRRRHRRLGELRRSQARKQGAGEIRQGLDRGADGGGNRRQRLPAGRGHPGAVARRAGLGAGGGAARGP